MSNMLLLRFNVKMRFFKILFYLVRIDYEVIGWLAVWLLGQLLSI